MMGRTIAHYRILREIGSGGMGVVYAAEDVRLGRQVAIKFVPDGMADDRQLLERLRSEARTASALNHPNICTLYDIGDQDGRPFMVMELLQGRTLRERLMAGPLRVDQTLEIGIQVSDALDLAHRQHIVHRDIKPANLFLNERGSVKILDFGLAKVVAHLPSDMTAAPTDLTSAGMTLGTVAYMSPEQVTGEALDGRSDIFSFGVVLYECVTGHQPFKGKTSGVILSEILNRTPPAPLVLNPDLPLRLQEIITNCLEKDRGLRYQDAAALRTDFRRLKRDLESGPRSVSRATIPVDAAGRSAVFTPSPSSEGATTSGSPARAPKLSRTGGVAFALIGIAVVAAAFLALRPTRPESNQPPPSAIPQSVVVSPVDRPAAPPPESAAPAAPVVRAQPSIVDRRPAPAPSPTVPRPTVAQRDVTATTAPPADTPASASVTPSAPSISVNSAPLGPVATPSAPAPPDLPKPSPAAAAPTSTPSPAPPAVAPVQDDDAAIRRVVAAYAHAIESKDIGAFKSVKPNLSAAEQRRLEDSFRAVASQKVDINVLGIERRGSTALVKVQRRDTLAVDGRSQISESQQTMTLIRSGAGWVISEIGR